jgi:hypothetical protein
LRDRLRTLQGVKIPTLARLNAALNRPAGAPLAWPANFPPAEISTSRERHFESVKKSQGVLSCALFNI